MNRIIQRTALSITALGAISLVRAELVLQQTNTVTRTSQSRPSTNHANTSWPAQIATEAVQAITGYADTATADTASDRTTPVQPSSSTVVASNTTTGQDQNSAVKDAINASPVTNPFGDAGPSCVPIALPISGTNKCIDNTGDGGAILVYTKQAILLLSGTVGGVIVLMIIVAGIQYITSMGNPGSITSAKKRLTNAITALIIFIMIYAIINFLLPGGITG